MATDEIQRLHYPDDYDRYSESRKCAFRDEFDGILACLDIDWDTWEDEYLHPKLGETFLNQVCGKLIKLQLRVPGLQVVKDKDLEKRIVKLNRYSTEMHRREGRVLGTEVRKLISDVKIANFHKHHKRMLDAGELNGEMKGETEEPKEEPKEEPGMRWEGGPLSAFNFGF